MKLIIATPEELEPCAAHVVEHIMCVRVDLLKNSFFLIFYLFIFREGKGGTTKGEKYQCVVASQAPPPGDLACNPGMYPDWESNQ